jgi:hypothetical protein
MSCCPSVRSRNVGSGYEKPDTKCASGASELDARLKEMMAARATQDAKIWERAHSAPNLRQRVAP